ncbi:MAG: hypothetical protein FVQ83_13440 [Chloroflexi bacterium]|nr:hypothetical protein [Chloroflexota bacterium]
MKRLFFSILALIILFPIQAAASPPAAGISTFSIQSVNTDTDVTILTNNFPAGENFTVTMGDYGTLGIGGTVVGNQASGAGGSFSATFPIPAAFHGAARIAIRLESTTSAYYAYNWFWNDTSGGGSPPPAPGPNPTFSIVSVNEDVDVTIQTSNFPAGDTFTVTMGLNGTKGVGGTVVGSQASGAGGSFSATFPIPAGLHGQHIIAIRLDIPTSPYYAYNWFYNSPGAASPAPVVPAPGLIPTFTITAVSKDNTVTISGVNFTLNDTYTVLIGAYGTQGVGGTVSGSQATDATGSFSATYTIPAGLHGATRIAIRLESDTSAYFSYNWFWNDNYP